MKQIFADRIAQVREMMEKNGWDAVVVSGSDPHASEYPAPRWQQVKWLSGFTGEAGDMVDRFEILYSGCRAVGWNRCRTA